MPGLHKLILFFLLDLSFNFHRAFSINSPGNAATSASAAIALGSNIIRLVTFLFLERPVVPLDLYRFFSYSIS